MRILLPQRLDVLSRAMCSGMFSMWLQQQHTTDLVFWGPGFAGYRPMPLDEAVRELDCDVVILPDLNHSIPGLWDELWQGAADCAVPVVMFLSDPGSAIGPRIDAIRRTRPNQLLILGSPDSYHQYRDVCHEVGAQIVQRPLGFDPDLFNEREPSAERDIDILVVGAADSEAYPIRRSIQIACRDLASRYRVMDLTHPGYWELSTAGLFSASRVFSREVVAAWARLFRSGGISLRESLVRLRVHRAKERQRMRLRADLLPAPARHGQAAFAELLRRTTIVVTGTTFGIVAEKYYESAACGAIGIGDAPPQPGSDEVTPAMIVVGPEHDEDGIRALVEAVLGDAAAQDRRRHAARALAGRTTHLQRAAEVTETLVESIGYVDRSHRELPFRQVRFEREYVGVVVQTDTGAPRPRRPWHDLRDPDRAGFDLVAVLEGSRRPLAAIALSSEAALPPDVHLLAECATRYRPTIACRPAEPTAHLIGGRDNLARVGWCLVVVDRETLLSTLRRSRSMESAADIARAMLEHAELHGVVLHQGPGFDEAGAQQLRASAREADRIADHQV